MEIEDVKALPTSELFFWKVYLEMDKNRPSRSDYYLAQIAREVHTVLMKKGDADKHKINHFVIKFLDPHKKKKKLPVAKPLPDPVEEQVDDEVPEEVKEKTIKSKQAWFAFLGIKNKAKFGE